MSNCPDVIAAGVTAEPIVLTNISVQLDFADVEKKLSQIRERSHLKEVARATFAKVNGSWKPAAVYRWLNCCKAEGNNTTHVLTGGQDSFAINLGVSSRFLDDAPHALLAAFSAGEELELAGRKASNYGEVLVAYLIDVIGLIVLEKVGKLAKTVAEDKASQLGWGVGPFLSPGSNPGWRLEEQLKLCSHLPIAEAGMRIDENAVLKPFKSLTCLIGVGPHYSSSKVESACLVCSRRKDCSFNASEESLR